jgi:threonyl-tRNA synthetase
MNCPFHIGIYKASPKSYRDLPQRYSELGTVYRAELSGAIHGLMRCRGFTVDDAHLFVRPDQIREEIADCLDFAIKVLKLTVLNEFDLNFRCAARRKIKAISALTPIGKMPKPRWQTL